MKKGVTLAVAQREWWDCDELDWERMRELRERYERIAGTEEVDRKERKDHRDLNGDRRQLSAPKYGDGNDLKTDAPALACPVQIITHCVECGKPLRHPRPGLLRHFECLARFLLGPSTGKERPL
jgi:hypothetical protein